MFNPSIAHAFRFSEDDLLQNKNGKISANQKAVLRHSGKVACIALMLLGLLIACGVYHVNKSKNNTALLIASIVFSVFAVTGGCFLFRAFYNASKAMMKKITGKATIVFKSRIGKCLNIGNINFPISGTSTEHMFDANKIYTVYYLGNTTILSIEET